MSRFWLSILPQVLFVFATTGVLWAAANAAAAFAFLSLSMLVPLLWMLRNLSRIDSWLDSPTVENIPEASGLWEGVFSRLRRMVKQRNLSERQMEIGAVQP